MNKKNYTMIAAAPDGLEAAMIARIAGASGESRGGFVAAGNGKTASAGYSGNASAGDYGEIRIRWYDDRNSRYRTAIGYIGENGLLPNVKYRLNAENEFEAVTP